MNTANYKKLLCLSIPISLQAALISSIGFIDSIMITKIGPISLAASGIGARWLWFVTIFIFCLSSGAGILLNQSKGKGDYFLFRKISFVTFFQIMIVATAALVTFLIFPEKLARIITDSDDVVKESVGYIRMVGIVIFLSGVASIFDAIFKSIAKVKITLYSYALEIVINVFLNYALIFGNFGFDSYGLLGAGYASIVSRAIRVCVLLVVIKQSVEIDFLKLHYISALFETTMVKKFHSLVWPIIVSSFLWALGNFTVHVIFGHMGSTELAIMSLVTPFEWVGLCIVSGVGQSAAIMIGHELGKNNYLDAEKLANDAIKLSFFAGTVVALLFTIIGYFVIIKYVGVSEELRSLLVFIFPISAFSIFLRSITSTQMAGVLRSGGDNKFCMYLDIICQWCIIIPIIYVMALHLSISIIIVYIVLQFEEVFKILPAMVRINKGYWRRCLVN